MSPPLVSWPPARVTGASIVPLPESTPPALMTTAGVYSAAEASTSNVAVPELAPTVTWPLKVWAFCNFRLPAKTFSVEPVMGEEITLVPVD